MHSDPPHGNVLVLAEDMESAGRLGALVAQTGERPSLMRAPPHFRPTLREQDSVDLVVTDLSKDDACSRAALERLLSADLFPDVPRIHLYRDDDLRADLVEGGPEASVLAMPFPPDPTEFQVRVRLGAEVGRLRRGLAQAETRDTLTPLSSRRFFLRRLEEEFARARRYRTPLSVVIVDLDQLGKVNRILGRMTGDSVIQQLAEIVRAQVRKEDLAGRLDGARIGVLLPGNRFRGAATLANKVRTDAEEILLQHGDDVYRVHVSAGISTFPDSVLVTSAEKLLAAAEAALGEAKSRGGNRVFIDETVLRQERRIVLVADPDSELLDLAEDLLSLDDYQVVRAETARVALETLRFRRPDLLVVDLDMADRETDAPLIEQIQSLFPSGNFPIIGLSRNATTAPEHLTRLGVDRFITKPFSVSLLRSAVRDLLQRTFAT